MVSWHVRDETVDVLLGLFKLLDRLWIARSLNLFLVGKNRRRHYIWRIPYNHFLSHLKLQFDLAKFDSLVEVFLHEAVLVLVNLSSRCD